MSRVLVIGCGGVASVAIQKCCQADEVFTELCIASRTKEKCDALARKLEGKTKTVITTAKVDADDVNQLIQLINSYKPDLVMNIALPYQDLTIMDACLATKTHYVDTANYEPEDTAKLITPLMLSRLSIKPTCCPPALWATIRNGRSGNFSFRYFLIAGISFVP